LVQKYGAEASYRGAAADLNRDGRNEWIVYVEGRYSCGSGGCPAMVFTPAASGYRIVTRTTVTQLPIRVSPRSSHGWRNLIVAISGGGVQAGNVELEFDGQTYPTNPTVPPARPVVDLNGAVALIADAPAPGFDCAKAASPAEKAICSSETLARLHRRMNELYASALRTAPDERSRQRTWTAMRNRCGASATCLESRYRRRIAELQVRTGQTKPLSPVRYDCTGNPPTRLTVSFYNETDPRIAVLEIDGATMVMFAALSASGARYTSAGVEFWEHHGEATLKRPASTLTCTLRK
jgi:uncharacterized protein